MNVDLRSLIGKLNHHTRNAVEAAAGLCLGRTHYDVEIEHFLMKLLDATDSDFAASCATTRSTARASHAT
jgi:type VI secretion system protein VasG